MTRSRSSRAALACCLSCLVAAGACAVNPATGKRQLSLIGESQEIEIGRENDKAVLAEMGRYDDTGLEGYVQEVGRRLAALSERPRLDWTFRVVDDPVVNAFALPGGFIYVTRGILAYMQNEAELASVLGHEIGHVTARHGVSQMSKAQVVEAGLGLGSILAPERTAQFGELLQTGLGLAFLKFSRDDERQADELGLRYLVAAGYDARPMADMFDMLDRIGSSSGGGPPAWMSTHPAPDNRRARAEQRIAALHFDFSNSPRGEETFLQHIDGIAFGDDPRQGYFKGRSFLHPALGFRIDFPDGWTTQNLRQAVTGASPDKDAIVQLSLTGAATPEAALDEFFSDRTVTRTGPAMGSISGLPTAGDGFTVEGDQGPLKGRVGFIELDGHVFRVLGYAAEYRFAAQEGAIRHTLASFDRLTDKAALAVTPKRVQIVRADRAITLEELARRHGATVPVETLALINRLDPGERLAAGRSYKVVVGGEIP